MSGRLFGTPDGDTQNAEAEQKFKLPTFSVERLNEMNKDLLYHGGPGQQSRMIRDKRRTLNRALLYSYQGAFVKKIPHEGEEFMEDGEEGMLIRALINPDKLKMDYDDKIISVGFEHKFKQGDVFEWVNTKSYWIVRL